MKKSFLAALVVASLSMVFCGHAKADFRTNRLNCIFMQGDTAKVDSQKLAAKPYAEAPLKYAPHCEVYNDKQAMIKVIKEVKTDKGNETTKWFFEVPDSIMGREILVVARCTKAPTGLGLFGGEELGKSVIYFSLTPDKKNIIVKQKTTNIYADTVDAISKAVASSDMDAIVGSYKVESASKGVYKIDASGFVTDRANLGMPASAKRNMQFGGEDAQASFVDYIHSYPINLELRTTKTYVSSRPDVATLYNGRMTFGINLSFVLLPKEPMRQRIFDQRVGYFNESQTVFSDNQQKVETKTYVARWRLEPKNEEDAQKQRNGQLIEPKKQIKYYVDPATPKQWRPYLIQGVKDWNKAFEHAGWKNAITAEEWPENDSTMSMEDARFSVIRYLATDQENAYGPNVHDYRTGEILESHIGWYHNIMSLVHNWYQIQCGAVDPEARKEKFNDELMGKLIRFVSSHEVGHTLGLRHNFGASNTVPTDSLRSNSFLTKYGHTPSIMDYARFDYVAQPEDNIDVENLFPRINDYDKWAIEWGYKPVEAVDSEGERIVLAEETTKRLAQSNRLRWGNGEDYLVDDYRNMPEDLGDDIPKTTRYFIANLKRILPHLAEWQYTNNDVQSMRVANSYNVALNQLGRLEMAMFSTIGGEIYTPYAPDEEGITYSYPSQEKREEALQYFNEVYFKEEPRWLTDLPYISRITNNDLDRFLSVIGSRSSTLTSPLYINSLNKNYNLVEYLEKVFDMIQGDYVNADKPLNSYRSSLIRLHVSNLIGYHGAEDIGFISAETVVSIVTFLKKLQATYRHAAEINSDPKTRNLYELFVDQIQSVIDLHPRKKTNTFTIFITAS